MHLPLAHVTALPTTDKNCCPHGGWVFQGKIKIIFATLVAAELANIFAHVEVPEAFVILFAQIRGIREFRSAIQNAFTCRVRARQRVEGLRGPHAIPALLRFTVILIFKVAAGLGRLGVR